MFRDASNDILGEPIHRENLLRGKIFCSIISDFSILRDNLPRERIDGTVSNPILNNVCQGLCSFGNLLRPLKIHHIAFQSPPEIHSLLSILGKRSGIEFPAQETLNEPDIKGSPVSTGSCNLFTVTFAVDPEQSQLSIFIDLLKNICWDFTAVLVHQVIFGIKMERG